MPPYIVTTIRPCENCGAPGTVNHRCSEGCAPLVAGSPVESRRAIATLEEARGTTADFIAVIVTHDWQRFADAAREIPESGGTVGPLPDGTVIEVEEVGWLELADMPGVRDRIIGETTKPRILDAFNAREATR